MLDCERSVAAPEMIGWAVVLADARFDPTSADADLLTLIEAAERLSAACAALQARATHEYSERRLTGLRVGSESDRIARRDIGATIARARHESPFHGTRHVELARMLVRDLPRTLHALAVGDTTEHRAALVAKAAACLGRSDRAALDPDLSPRLAGMGHRRVDSEANRLAAQLDPQSVVERHRRAVHERRVTLRPAPDSMSYLTALLPVADGVAALAALHRHAALATATGDHRGRGRVMADEMVRRLVEQPGNSPFVDRSHPADAATGGTTAGAPTDPQRSEASAVPHRADAGPATIPATRQIDLMLVMTDRALLDGADTPAIIAGHGPIPAALARGLLADADPATRVFLRRLYRDPSGTTLLSTDARGRVFPHAVRQFVLARDQRCRTPWCDAAIRHIDHAAPHSAGGPTSLVNAQGLCERCNLRKAKRTGAAVATAPPPPAPRSEPWGAGRAQTERRPVVQMAVSAAGVGRPIVPAADR